MTLTLLTRSNDTPSTVLEQQRLPQGASPQPAPAATAPSGNPLFVKNYMGSRLALTSTQAAGFPYAGVLVCDCLEERATPKQIQLTLQLPYATRLQVSYVPAPLYWMFTSPAGVDLSMQLSRVFREWRDRAGDRAMRAILLDHDECQYGPDDRARRARSRWFFTAANRHRFGRNSIGLVLPGT